MIYRHIFKISEMFLAILVSAVVLSSSPALADKCEIIAYQASTLTIPLVREQESGIEAIDIRIEFDVNVLEVKEVTLTGGILEDKDYSLTYTISEGEIKIVIYATGDMAETSGEMGFVTFDIIGNPSDASGLSVTDFRCNSSESGGFHINGEICTDIELTQFRDTDNDGRIGIAEAIHALRCTSGIEECDSEDMGLEDAVHVLKIVTGI
ncbi:cohesin domain-containing protein [Desulfococcaceae bacterium HSG8]|nr:cohesin domain-containing protein [Desulfococcaceae bacterium HSG8]